MLKCKKCGNSEGFMKLECTQIVQEELENGVIETTSDVFDVLTCEKCKGHEIEEVK